MSPSQAEPRIGVFEECPKPALPRLAAALEAPNTYRIVKRDAQTKEGRRMRNGVESPSAQPPLVLDYDDLLLLEAVLCFHTRASTSADLRARLADLWERVGRLRVAASPLRSGCARTAHVRARGAEGLGLPGAEPGGN